MSFKICFVGCGNISSAVHGPSCRRYAELNPGVELAACCDIIESKAALFSEKFGFSRYYTDLERMLDIEKPQAVCLVSPIPLTAGLSCKIMDMGYPLIMEKPPGFDSNETREMIRTAQKKNVPNQVAFNRRYVPLMRELKKLVDGNKRDGGYMNIHFHMLRVEIKEPDFSMTAIHGIDAVKFLAGEEYRHVSFRYQELSYPGVVNIHLDCEFKSGALATLDFLPVSGTSVERLEICTDDNTFYLNMAEGPDKSGKLIHMKINDKILEIEGAQYCGSDEKFILNGFYDENASFFDDIRNGRKPAGDIQSALQSVEIAECIRNRAKGYTG